MLFKITSVDALEDATQRALIRRYEEKNRSSNLTNMPKPNFAVTLYARTQAKTHPIDWLLFDLTKRLLWIITIETTVTVIVTMFTA